MYRYSTVLSSKILVVAPRAAMVRLSSIKLGGTLRLSILGVVTYVLVVARTGTPTVPTALGVPYGYAPAVTRQTAEEGVGQVT